jgi:hypothetical protein
LYRLPKIYILYFYVLSFTWSTTKRDTREKREKQFSCRSIYLLSSIIFGYDNALHKLERKPMPKAKFTISNYFLAYM